MEYCMFYGHTFIISGPSGVGKDTVMERLFRYYKLSAFKFHAPRAYTTREPRGDKSDDTYIFVTDEEFDKLRPNEMLESSVVHGHKYGMSKEHFHKAMMDGEYIIKSLDTVGAKTLKDRYKEDVTTIFIKPPSIEKLEQQLRGRKTETEEQIERRMSDTLEELKHVGEYDFVVTNYGVDFISNLIEVIINLSIREKNAALREYYPDYYDE